MIKFLKKHRVTIIIAVVVVIVAIVVVSGLRRERKSPPFSQVSDERMEFPESEGTSVEEPQESPPPPSSEEEKPVQQTQIVESAGTSEAVEAQTQKRRREELDREIRDLQNELRELRRRTAQLRMEDNQRAEARDQVLQMLESHASHIENLGNTLRQVFKTPAQIRIIATDLENQASRLQEQMQSEARTVGSSSIGREILALRRTVMEQQAADLKALALDLQRTGGEPAKVRIIAIRIQEKAEGIQANIQSKRREKIEPNPELQSLENKQVTLQNRIQQLQKQQRELGSQ